MNDLFRQLLDFLIVYLPSFLQFLVYAKDVGAGELVEVAISGYFDAVDDVIRSVPLKCVGELLLVNFLHHFSSIVGEVTS